MTVKTIITTTTTTTYQMQGQGSMPSTIRILKFDSTFQISIMCKVSLFNNQEPDAQKGMGHRELKFKPKSYSSLCMYPQLPPPVFPGKQSNSIIS